MSGKAQGAIQSGVGAVLNSDQGAETVSTADLLQAMSLVQHELEEAEVRTHRQLPVCLDALVEDVASVFLKINLYAMCGRTPEVQKMVANPKKVNEMAQNLKQMRMAVPHAACD